MTTEWKAILADCHEKGEVRYRREKNQTHFIISSPNDLLMLCESLYTFGAYLVTVVANDERELINGRYKHYYYFSHPTKDQFLILEWQSDRADESPPVQKHFRAATAFLGDDDVAINEAGQQMIVGPNHAGIIEAGQFRFQIIGEQINQVTFRFGWKKREIEKLFTTNFSLLDGWQLAERIVGDTAYAHSLAYCRAVESMAGVEVPKTAVYLRGIFLEIERLYNHVRNYKALANDVAAYPISAELSVLWQYLMELNERLSGHRLLFGVNRPGGVVLPDSVRSISHDSINRAIFEISEGRLDSLQTFLEHFLVIGNELLNSAIYQERALFLGILTKSDAVRLGIRGLTARASNWKIKREDDKVDEALIRFDFRLNHPCGVYKKVPALRDIILATEPELPEQHLRNHEMRGDVYARTHLRLLEIKSSVAIIQTLLTHLGTTRLDVPLCIPIEDALQHTPNFEFAVGYAEGWRGDVIYWLMKDRFGQIYRCQVRDPSLFNWAALKAAVDLHRLPSEYIKQYPQTPNPAAIILADFPLVNQSFNLSYAGYDL